MPRTSERRTEMVAIIGPVDATPGKKMNYPVRWVKRGTAESKDARLLGIQILPDYKEGDEKSITVENKVVQTRGPGRKSIAEIELAKAQKEIEALKEKLKNSADAPKA